MIEIFPHILFRLAGLPYNILAPLNCSRLSKEVSELDKLNDLMQREKKLLSQYLLDFNKEQNDRMVQQKVQNFRRDLYNGRRIKRGQEEQIRSLLPNHLVDKLDAYLVIRSREAKLETEFDSIYNEAINSNWDEVRVIASNLVLQKGIVLSGYDFFLDVERFSEMKAGTLSTKDQKIGLGILKYASRIGCKTSPFSFFTNISVTKISETSKKGIELDIDTDESAIIGFARLNNLLFKYLKDLLLSYRDVYLLLSVKVNPSIRITGEGYRYIVNNDNIESFQKIESDPILDYILKTFDDHPAGIIFNNLIEELKENVDAQVNEIEDYVKQLIDLGLIEYDFGVSGLDPEWDISLRKLISRDLKHLKVMRDLDVSLKHLRDISVRFGIASPKDRMSLLQSADEVFRNICFKIHEAADLPIIEREQMVGGKRDARKVEKNLVNDFEKEAQVYVKEDKEISIPYRKRRVPTNYPFHAKRMFYDDSTRALKASINAKQFEDITLSLAWLCENISGVSMDRLEAWRLRDYFIDRFGIDAEVSFLDVYEFYYREVRRPIDEYERALRKQESNRAIAVSQDDTENAIQKPGYYEIDEFNKESQLARKWQIQLVNEIDSKQDLLEEINISKAQIKNLNKSLGICKKLYNQNSFGSLIQLYNDGSTLKGVVNSVFVGYGKLLSRFLHILPNEVKDDTRTWNARFNDNNSFHIENTDASYFNANLHPPMLNWEMQVPNGQNQLSTSNQIKVVDLEVKLDKRSNELILVHKPTKKRCYIYDLAFQGGKGRSNMFQLLNYFSKPKYPHYQMIAGAFNSYLDEHCYGNGQESVVRVYPRIVFDQVLTLQRKCWFFPVNYLPSRNSGDTDADYFKFVNKWAKNNNIPESIFVYVNPNRQRPEDASEKRRRSFDDYKPQYVNLGSPVMVLFFEKLLRKVSMGLKVEEMHPQASSIKTKTNGPWVSEALIQWYIK